MEHRRGTFQYFPTPLTLHTNHVALNIQSARQILRYNDVRVLVSVRPSVRQSHRRVRYLSLVCLSSSAACLRIAGTLAPEPVSPLSLSHLAILSALHRGYRSLC